MNSARGMIEGPEFTEVPPYDVDAEQSVLGAILLDNCATPKALATLTSKDFWREAHQAIYAAIETLYEAGEPIDSVTLMNRLKETGYHELISHKYIVALLDAVPTSANIEYYVAIVAEKAWRRSLIEKSGRLSRISYDLEAEAGEVETAVEAVSQAAVRQSKQKEESVQSGADVVNDVMEEILQRREAPELPRGLKFHFGPIDQFLPEVEPDFLMLLCAKEGTGKTAFMLHLAQLALRRGRRVAMVSLEMSRKRLMRRMVGSMAGVDTRRLQSGRLEDWEVDNLIEARNEIAEWPLEIVNPFDDSAEFITSLLTESNRRRKIDLVVFDYWQLCHTRTKSFSRVEDLTSVTMKLRSFVSRHGIPMLLLAQLNREAFRAKDQEPDTQHIEGCGAASKSADVVMFLHPAAHRTVHTRQQEVRLIVRKNRDGLIGQAPLLFDLATQQFRDLRSRVEAGQNDPFGGSQ